MNIGEQATLPAGNVSLCLSVSCGGKRLDFIVQSPYP